VWYYFHCSKNLITFTCAIIIYNGKKCDVSYNDSFTISNLISYLTQIHKVYKLNEKKIDNCILIN